MRSICIIPAKAHSERIPNKNIRDFCGQPIIKYSIDVALASGLFQKVVVSTDSDKIGTLIAKYGAIYHKRPGGLAEASAPMVDVVLETLAHHSQDNYDYVCMLYPCAPFVTVEQLVHGQDRLAMGYDLCFPIFRGPHVEQSMIIQNDKLIMRYPEHLNEPSQIWPESYLHAGMWFWAEIDSLCKRRSFVSDRMWGEILPWYLVQDIDTEEDWIMAEIKYKYLQEMQKK